VSASTARRDRTRRAAIIAGSLVCHGLVFALLGLAGPRPREVRRVDPEPVMIDLRDPPPAGRTRHRSRALSPPPSPIRPRRAVSDVPPAGMAPLPMAPSPGPAGPTAPSGAVAGNHPALLPGEARGDLRSALRGSTVGCANRDAVGLTRREREACDEAYGGEAETAFIEPPMEAATRARFDAVAARKDAARKRKEDPVPPGIDGASNAGGTRTNGIGILPY